jgi:hypothetical protein
MLANGKRRIWSLASLVLAFLFIAACGGGGGGNSSNSDSSAQKASVSGSISFPSLSVIVAKQAAAVVPPLFTITDLAGNVIATPAVTADPLDPKKFTYNTTLDPSKNFVLKASWGGQVLRGLADQSTLRTMTTVVNVTPVSTAAVLVTERKLELASGQLGTAAASTVSDAQVSGVNPAALLSAIETGSTTTYAPLVTEVLNALNNRQDPAAVATVTTAVTNAAPSYTVPPKFTTAMVAGKTFKDDNGTTTTFNSNGTLTTSKNANTNSWVLNPDGTILISYRDLNTNTSGWDRLTLVQDNSPTALVINDLNINGTLYANQTWTYYVPPANSPAYSNLTFTGAWLLLPSSATTPIYFIGNGNGVVTDHSAYNLASPAGSYSVQPNGAYALNLNTTGDGTIPLSGTLTSESAGSVSWTGGSGAIAEVTNHAACQGAWSGTLRETATTSAYTISYAVDTNGAITSFTGFAGPVSGKMFCESGTAVAFFKTGAADGYNQFKIWGSLSGTTVSGSFDNDYSSGTLGTVTLTRQGATTSRNVLLNFNGQNYPLRMTVNKDSSGNFIATNGNFDFHKDATTGVACTYTSSYPNCVGVSGSISSVSYNGATITMTASFGFTFTGTYSNGVYSGTWEQISGGITRNGAFYADLP